ncbi:MAG TPA: hypothetical protein VF707_07100 [Ardenticatenaceae bacterium]|jgi:hypothetical protein
MSDISSQSDVAEAQDSPPESTRETMPLSETGREAMQGPTDTNGLEARVAQLKAETEARESAELAALKSQNTEQQSVTNALQPQAGDNPVAEAPPEHTPRSAATELGQAEIIETGAERPEVTNFDAEAMRRRGPEG